MDEAVTDLGVLREETGGRIEVGDLPDIDADGSRCASCFRI